MVSGQIAMRFTDITSGVLCARARVERFYKYDEWRTLGVPVMIISVTTGRFVLKFGVLLDTHLTMRFIQGGRHGYDSKYF